jgi:hypothetical protein
MALRSYIVNEQTVWIAPDDPVPLSDRTWGVVRTRLVDELNGEVISTRVSVKCDQEGFYPRVGADGVAGLAAIPSRVFPELASQAYDVTLTIGAEGYISEDHIAALPADPGFPVSFTPADLGNLELHREPIVLRGRTVVANGNTTSPAAGANVSITGYWATVPPADAVIPADPPNFVSLAPTLYFVRTAATASLRQREMNPVAGEDKTLLTPVAAGDSRLRLSDRINLNPADVVWIEADAPGNSEYAIVASISGAGTEDQPADVTLSYPIRLAHFEGVLIRRVLPQAPGLDNALTRDAIARDACVFLDAMNDLAAAEVIEIHDGIQPPEFHHIQRFDVLSDAEGYYRLPLLSRAAQIELTADDGIHPAISRVYCPDYVHFENIIDFVFR